MFGIFHNFNVNHVFVIKVEHTSRGKAWVKSSLPLSCGWQRKNPRKTSQWHNSNIQEVIKMENTWRFHKGLRELEFLANIIVKRLISPLKWTALMSMSSRLGGKADRKSVIFPFVAFSTQSFICCRLFKTAGSESYQCWDLLTKSCFGWNPETHKKHTHSLRH